jgi:hypothetical protein
MLAARSIDGAHTLTSRFAASSKSVRYAHVHA